MLEQDPGEPLPQPRVSSARASADVVAGKAPDAGWVDAQLARLDQLLAAHVDPEALARLLLLELAPLVAAERGAVYTMNHEAPARLVLCGTYAAGVVVPESVAPGEGLVGECAIEQRMRRVRSVPEDHLSASTALGSGPPGELAIVPVWLDAATLAVLELGFVDAVTASADALLDRLSERRGGALRGAAAAGSAPRSRPTQRFGFWGKLSHELRSPLNSVLVLSKLLSENADDNLTTKQIAFAKAIHRSGSDLLALVNALSDLSKIETNRLVLEPTEMTFEHFRAHLLRAFEPVASARGLGFSVRIEPGLPESIVTDAKRLRQIMKSLLSNAFKFTENGGVSVSVGVRSAGWSRDHERLNAAERVIAFSVADTGIGMSESEQLSILDAFPPERVESRRGAGASGLGLAISRELARILGGELRLSSSVGSGSTFTLYVPEAAFAGAGTMEQPPESAPSRVPANASALIDTALTSESSSESRTARGERESPASEWTAVDLSGLSVLLIDEDVRSAFTMTGFLERQGVAVSHAEGVLEALERLNDGRRAAVLLIDAELLAHGPSAAVQQMLERYEGASIIALSRGAAAGALRSALPARAQLLSKPVDPRQLVSALSNVAALAKSFQS